MRLEGLAGVVLVFLSWAVFAVTAFAFVNAARQRPDAYPAADKLTKPKWLGILGVAGLLSWVLGGFGVTLCALALLRQGQAMERWCAKPIVLVLGSLVVFALTIERTGLLISSVLAVGLAGLAAPQQRLRQTMLLAVCLAGFACVLFPFALQLPLRILP
jgi:heme/copper-type cytochrome/quinol oxidase subunit 3